MRFEKEEVANRKGGKSTELKLHRHKETERKGERKLEKGETIGTVLK